MVLWLTATIARFSLTVEWVRAFGPRQGDRDDLAFHSAVIGLGSLQAILHTIAFSVGLSLGRGLATLAAAPLVTAVAFWTRRLRRISGAPAETPSAVGRPARVLALAGGGGGAALLWLVGYSSVLPLFLASKRLRWGAGIVLTLVSVAWYIGHQGVPQAPPEEALAQLTATGALLGLSLWELGATAARLKWRVLVAPAGGIPIAAIATADGLQAIRSDARPVRSAEAELDRGVSCATCNGVNASDYRRTYFGLLNDERAHGVQCSRRRLFMAARWDYPLELQSIRFDNLLFDVRGPSFAARLIERARPGTTPCSYVVAARAALDTTNGVELVNTLRAQGHLTQVAEAGRLVVFAAR